MYYKGCSYVLHILYMDWSTVGAVVDNTNVNIVRTEGKVSWLSVKL